MYIDDEKENKYHDLKQQKISATKAHLERKGVLHQFPKDNEFWDKFVDWIDNQIRLGDLMPFTGNLDFIDGWNNEQ